MNRYDLENVIFIVDGNYRQPSPSDNEKHTVDERFESAKLDSIHHLPKNYECWCNPEIQTLDCGTNIIVHREAN